MKASDTVRRRQLQLATALFDAYGELDVRETERSAAIVVAEALRNVLRSADSYSLSEVPAVIWRERNRLVHPGEKKILGGGSSRLLLMMMQFVEGLFDHGPLGSEPIQQFTNAIGLAWPGVPESFVRALETAARAIEAEETTPPQEFSFYLDPGNATPQEITDVLVALSDLHVAAGGDGLRFKVEGDRVFVSDSVLA